MATSIPTNRFIDQGTVLARDQARNRSITLSLQNKFAPTRDALWADHQRTLYPEVMQVRNTPSLQNLLANELESANQNDPLQLEALGRTNLRSITDEATTDYIMDRLTDDDINNLNQNFPTILKTITTKYKSMDKNKFIDIVKSKQEYLPEFEITERGQRRQNSLADLKEQQQSDYEEVQSRPNREAEVRAMREEDRLGKPRERGVASPVDRDRLNFEDIYPNATTPMKSKPRDIKPADTPDKERGFYGDIFTSAPPKPTNEEEEAILDAVEREVSGMSVKSLKEYIKNLTNNRKIQRVYTKPDLVRIATILGYENRTGATVKTGSGFRRVRRIIQGRGSPERAEEDEENAKPFAERKKMSLNGGKFAISLEKLRRNVLYVYYTISHASIPSLKREHITNDTRDVLLDILLDKYNARIFNKLQPDEQRLISTFVRVMKIPGISMDEFDKSYNDHFQILSGEINSGNTNPKIIQEYKQYVVRGMQEGLIPRHAGLNLLFKISI